MVMGLIKKFMENPYPMRYVISKKIRMYREGYSREHYKYCIDKATSLAVSLKASEISIIEFGVAGGNGLIEIERICARKSLESGIAFSIYGFDTGQGLPPPEDYRDLPYQWQEGFFSMDLDALRSRLRTSKLVIGNVRETVPDFVARGDHPPIGAVMFDLDYYSSTVDALGIFRTERVTNHLPRVQCYFDDIGGIPSAGAGLSISEFNRENSAMKVENPLSLRNRREFRDWGWRIFEFHHFTHPQYAVPVVQDDQLPLV